MWFAVGDRSGPYDAAHWRRRAGEMRKLLEFDRVTANAYAPLRSAMAALLTAAPREDMHELVFRFLARYWFASRAAAKWACADDELTPVNMAWLAKVYDVGEVRPVPPAVGAALAAPALIPGAFAAAGYDVARPWAPAHNSDFTEPCLRVLLEQEMVVPALLCADGGDDQWPPSAAAAATTAAAAERPDPAVELAQWFDVWYKLGGPAPSALPADGASLAEREAARLELLLGPDAARYPQPRRRAQWYHGTGVSSDGGSPAQAERRWRAHRAELGGRDGGGYLEYMEMCAARGVEAVVVDDARALAERFGSRDAVAKALVRRELYSLCASAEDADTVEAWAGAHSRDEFWKLKGCTARRVLDAARAEERRRGGGGAGNCAAEPALSDLRRAPLAVFLRAAEKTQKNGR